MLSRSHCWESPRAFSVKSKYKLALSVHPGARIASAGILAIQIKCFNAFLPDSVEARGEAGIEGIRLTPGEMPELFVRLPNKDGGLSLRRFHVLPRRSTKLSYSLDVVSLSR